MNLETSNRKFSDNPNLQTSKFRQSQENDDLIKSWKRNPNLSKTTKRLYERYKKEKILNEKNNFLKASLEYSEKKNKKRVVISDNHSVFLDDNRHKLIRRSISNTK